MIQVNKTLTATNADVLSGTDLNAIPRSGEFNLVLVDDAGTSTISVLGPGVEPTVNNIKAQKRTNGQPVLSDDPPIQIPVSQGGHFTINFTLGAGATTATLVCSWEDDSEIIAKVVAGVG